MRKKFSLVPKREPTWVDLSKRASSIATFRSRLLGKALWDILLALPRAVLWLLRVLWNVIC